MKSNFKDMLLALGIALALTAVLTSPASASWPGPDEDTEWVSSWNWGLVAYVKGQYADVYPPYRFDWTYHEASRWSSWGVWWASPLYLTSKAGIAGESTYARETSTDDWTINDGDSGTFEWAKSRAKAQFGFIGTWWAETDEAVIAASA